jgi:hypothetical protein
MPAHHPSLVAAVKMDALAPGETGPDDVSHLAAAGCDARHRRDVIGLQRVLQAQRKTQGQYASIKPACPAREPNSLRGLS